MSESWYRLSRILDFRWIHIFVKQPQNKNLVYNFTKKRRNTTSIKFFEEDRSLKNVFHFKKITIRIHNASKQFEGLIHSVELQHLFQGRLEAITN